MNPNDTPAKGHPKRQNPQGVTAYVVIAILSMLKAGSRMGSQEIQDRLSREYGVSVTLRTVQRHLARLTELFPVEADDEFPRGWRWAKTERAIAMRETVLMAREAA